MSGLRVGLAMLVVAAGVGTSARAQGVGFVPGGWSPQVGFQSFNGPGFFGGSAGYGAVGFGAGYSPYGYGYNYNGFGNNGFGYNGFGYGGYSPYGMGGYRPSPFGGSAVPGMGVPQTTNAMGPLIQAVHKTTTRRRGR